MSGSGCRVMHPSRSASKAINAVIFRCFIRVSACFVKATLKLSAAHSLINRSSWWLDGPRNDLIPIILIGSML